MLISILYSRGQQIVLGVGQGLHKHMAKFTSPHEVLVLCQNAITAITHQIVMTIGGVVTVVQVSRMISRLLPDFKLLNECLRSHNANGC